MLVQIEGAYATPGPMGRIKGSEVAIANSEQLIDLIGPEAILPYGADGTIAQRRDRGLPPGGPGHRDLRRHGRGVPDHHRPAPPGPAPAGLPRPQGLPHRRPARHSSGIIQTVLSRSCPVRRRTGSGPGFNLCATRRWPSQKPLPGPITPDSAAAARRSAPCWKPGPDTPGHRLTRLIAEMLGRDLTSRACVLLFLPDRDGPLLDS
jgi:hypothetical protein